MFSQMLWKSTLKKCDILWLLFHPIWKNYFICIYWDFCILPWINYKQVFYLLCRCLQILKKLPNFFHRHLLFQELNLVSKYMPGHNNILGTTVGTKSPDLLPIFQKHQQNCAQVFDYRGPEFFFKVLTQKKLVKINLDNFMI